MFVFMPLPRCFMCLVFYSFILSGPWTTSQDSHHSLWVSVYIHLRHIISQTKWVIRHIHHPQCSAPWEEFLLPQYFQVTSKLSRSLYTNYAQTFSSVSGDPCTQVWAIGLNEKPEYSRGGSHDSLHFHCLLSDSTCVTAVSQWITGHWIVCFWMPNRLVQDGQFWLQGQFMSRDQMLILY